MSARGERLLTRRQLAAVPDLPGQAGPVHPQTVTKWEQDGLPIAQRGRKGKASLYRESDVRAWLQAREDFAKAAEGPLDLAHERARKEHWQAMLAEQTHKTRDGLLLPRADVEKVWAAELAAVRTKLLALPLALAARLYRISTLQDEAAVERALEEAVRDVLRELAGVDEAAPPAPRRRRRKDKSA